jgi:hypothetical protein
MNCQHFEELAQQIAHQELRDAALLQDAQTHAATCASCADLLNEARTVAASLAAVAAQDNASQDAAHLEPFLRAAFLREHPALVGERPSILNSREGRPARLVFRWAALSLLAAAIILAALFLPRVLNRKPETNHATATPTQSPSTAVSQETTPANASPQTPVVAAVAHKRITTLRHAPKKNAAASDESLTGFVLLPYADAPSTIRSGSIVRVSIPRSSLGWFGFPVVSSNPKDRVVADLLMNQSGTPEAIRLVQ